MQTNSSGSGNTITPTERRCRISGYFLHLQQHFILHVLAQATFPSSESTLSYCRIKVGCNLKNAFNHTFDYHLSYDRKLLITVKTAGTNLLTKGRDPCLESEMTDLQTSTHRQLNSLWFPRAKQGYSTTPILLLLLDIHIKAWIWWQQSKAP